MGHGRKLLPCTAADAVGGRIGRFERRIGFLQLLELTQETVVFKIRDLGRIVVVVEIVVIVNGFAQRVNALLRFMDIQGKNSFFCR